MSVAGPIVPSDLTRFRVLHGLSADGLKAVFDSLIRHTIRAHQSLAGPAFTGLAGLVWSGRIIIQQFTTDGVAALTRDVGPNGEFALLTAMAGDEPSPLTRVTALEPAMVLTIPWPILSGLMSTEHGFALSVANTMMRMARRSTWRFSAVNLLSARERLVIELVRLSNGSSPPTIEPRPTQTALATAIGAAREHVSRQLSALAEEQLIEQTPSGIRLLDVDRMLDSIAQRVGQDVVDILIEP